MSNAIVITGASRGIGLAFVKHYINLGKEVYGVCRQASSQLLDTGAHILDGVDIASAYSVAKLSQSLGTTKIALLINNAGILRDEKLGTLNYTSILEQFEVNTLGALRVTEALLPQLLNPSKVVLITSRMGSIEDNTSGGYYGYRISKAGLNAAGKSLAHDLKPRGIAVGILHPGYVATDMVGGTGNVTAAQAVDMLQQRIEELNLTNTGSFWHANGEVLPW